MLPALVDAKFGKHLLAETVLRQHPFNRLVNDEVGLFGHHSAVRNLFESADITGVISVELLFEFLTRKQKTARWQPSSTSLPS